MRRSSKTVAVKLELSAATGGLLEKLEQDMQVVSGLLQELVDSQRLILERISGELSLAIDAALAEQGLAADEDGGPEVFQRATAFTERTEVKLPVPAPEIMAGPKTDMQTLLSDEDRLRGSPFTRAPRSTQVAWLEEVLSDGRWSSAVALAREYANDERHFRYLRGAIGGRLREMHEDGLVERRDSHVKGSMFEYRLKKADDA